MTAAVTLDSLDRLQDSMLAVFNEVKAVPDIRDGLLAGWAALNMVRETNRLPSYIRSDLPSWD